MKKLNLFLNLLFWASLTIQAQNWVNKKVKGNGAVKPLQEIRKTTTLCMYTEVWM